ncbi:hypothetical protein [Planctomicrobium sp. SH664]|uniref:hypothetical protein n=1 Tax=Planctomicrobium sp. SH664 TaxID=3448125 RepID=UPI003F5C37E7
MNRSQIEVELTAELQRLEPYYRRALELMIAEAKIPATCAADVTACLNRLQPLMSQIQAAESKLAPLRLKWLSASTQPGPQLKALLQGHEHLLKQLIQHLNDLEARARQLRNQLLPALDSGLRHQQMQRAYQTR